MHRSPYHGLNLCCGTLAEMLWDPEREIYDIVRRLARTKRLFNIHLRNIRGRRDDFLEVWPDEGEVTTPGSSTSSPRRATPMTSIPTTSPTTGRPGGKQAYAQGYGFILGAIKGAEHRAHGRR